MKIKSILTVGILICLIVFTQILPAQEATNKLSQKLQQIASDLENNLSVSKPLSEETLQELLLFLRGMTYNEDGLEATSPFGDYMTDKFEIIIDDSQTFRVIPRSKIRSMVKSRDWTIEEVTPVLPENLGAMAGAEAVLYGTFEDYGDRVKISTFIKDVKTRNIVSDASVIIPKEDIPTEVSLYAENHEEVSFEDMSDQEEYTTNSYTQPEETVTYQETTQYEEPAQYQEPTVVTNDVDMDVASDNRIQLDVFVNHSPEAVYRVGEELKIYIRTDKDCYIRILYRDSEGDDMILFPISEQHDDYFYANQTYEIPPEGSYRIVASEPFGTECLKVFASSDPFGELDSIEVPEIRARGMKIEMVERKPAYGEKSITIRVSQ